MGSGFDDDSDNFNFKYFQDVAYEPFVPLTDDEEDCVSDALSGFNRYDYI